MPEEISSFSFFERDKIYGLQNKVVKEIYHFGDLVLFEFEDNPKIPSSWADGKYSSIEKAAKHLVDKQKVLLLKYFQKDLSWVQTNIESGVFNNEDYLDFRNFINPAKEKLIASSGDEAYQSILHCVKNGILSDHITLKIIDQTFFNKYQKKLLELRKAEKMKVNFVVDTIDKLNSYKIFIDNNKNSLIENYGIENIEESINLLENCMRSCKNLSSFYLSKNIDDLENLNLKIHEFKSYIKNVQSKEEQEQLEREKARREAEKERLEKERINKNRDFINKIKTTYNIEYLYHFTYEFNIPSIEKYGLLGWETLEGSPYNFKESKDYKAASNSLSRDLDVRGGFTDYVRLSKTKNHDMVDAARQRYNGLVFLKIKLEILTDLNCKFANDNSTVTRRPLVIDEDYRTFFESDQNQAEILVLHHIPANYIIGKEV